MSKGVSPVRVRVPEVVVRDLRRDVVVKQEF
jgi:hypothetical protein